MKKIIILLSVLIVAIHVDAQVKLGFKAGLNLGDMAFTKNTSLNDVATNRTGWHLGLAAKINLPLHLTLQPELLFSTKGVNNVSVEDPSGTPTNVTEDFVFNYLEIPVNLQWGISLGKIRPFVMVSPYLSYLIDSRAKIDELNSWDGGIGLGAGIDIWKAQITFKYVWGIGNVGSYKQNVGGSLEDISLQNRTIQLSLGFFI